MTWKIEHNDVIEWARNYDGPPFHAMICDPPYHLTSITKRFSKPGSKPPKGGVYKRTSAGFMLSGWDGLGESGKGIAFDPATWAALADHLYPGAFIMAFGGSRGYHRMATAMEDAGLIIHPAMGWLTLSGFPKATRIDTQIDKAAGAERERVKNYQYASRKPNGASGIAAVGLGTGENITVPATPLARDWAGHRYGLQALKPAFEFIAVAQVPYEGRPVDSIVATGAGALNIDGGRIDWQGEADKENGRPASFAKAHNGFDGKAFKIADRSHRNPEAEQHPAGRWPSNFLLQCGCDPNRTDPAHQENCPVRLFDEQAGESGPGGWTKSGDTALGQKSGWNSHNNREVPAPQYDDSGPASRMFHQADFSYEVAEALAGAEPVRYEPKVSSSERDAGLDELETRTRHRVNAGGLENEPRFAPTQVKNNHPTLKPISLTKYLATLLLPPAVYAPRRILVPFSGVSSEMIGCVLAGWEEVIGIESNAAYAEIAEARLRWWSQWPGWGQTDVDAILTAAGKEDTGQLSLFKAA